MQAALAGQTIQMTLVGVDISVVICTSVDLENIGSSRTAGHRGIIISLDAASTESSYTFTLTCTDETDSTVSDTATITLNVQRIVISADPITVNTFSASLSIGTADTNDIVLTLTNVDIDDVTCTSSDGDTITPGEFTIAITSTLNFDLTCSTASGITSNTIIVQVTHQITPTITIENQTINVPAAGAVLALVTDIDISIAGITLANISCTSADVTDIESSVISGRQVTITPNLVEGLAESSYTFTLTCTDSVSSASATATITLNVQKITIDDQTVDVTSNPATLNIGTENSDNIRIALQHVDIGDVGCTDETDIADTSGTSTTVRVDEGIPTEIIITCMSTVDARISGNGTITISNTGAPSITMANQTIPIGAGGGLLSFGEESSNHIQLVLNNVARSDVRCTSSDLSNIGTSTINNRMGPTIVPPNPIDPSYAYEFTLTCSDRNSDASATATITVNIRELRITTRSVDIGSTPTTLSIGVEESDDIKLRLRHVEMSEVTCTIFSSNDDVTINRLSITIPGSIALGDTHTFNLFCGANAIKGHGGVSHDIRGLAVNHITAPSISIENQSVYIPTPLPNPRPTLSIGNAISDNVQITVGGGVTMDNVECVQAGLDGRINVAARTITFGSVTASDFPITFNLECSSSRAGTDNIDTVTSTAEITLELGSISISADPKTVGTLPATLSIGTASSNDIVLALTNLEIDQVTCTTTSSGITITPTEITVNTIPGSSTFPLTCATGIVSSTATITLIVQSINLEAQNIDITSHNAELTIGNTPSDDIQITLVGVDINDVSCTSTNIQLLPGSIDARTVTLDLPVNTDTSRFFQLMCSTESGIESQSVFITLSIPKIDISADDVTVDTSPATLSIGTASSNDIVLTLTRVNINDITCTTTSSGITITPTEITVAVAPGGNSNFQLTCSTDEITSNTETITVNYPLTAPTITIDDGQAITDNGIVSSFSIDTDASADITITLENTSISDVICTEDSDNLDINDDGTTIIVETHLEPGESTSFELTCTATNSRGSDTATTTIMLSTISIIINDQTIDISDNIDDESILTIGNATSDDIQIILHNVPSDGYTCTSGVNTIGTSQQNQRSIVINLPDNPENSYTIELTCRNNDRSASSTGTITLNAKQVAVEMMTLNGRKSQPLVRITIQTDRW